MPHFIVTFRIKNDTTYQDRYDTFVNKARELANNSGLWEETTSFMAFASVSSQSTAESICSDLYLGSGFDSTKDVMVVIDTDGRKKATKGEIKYPNTLSACLGF